MSYNGNFNYYVYQTPSNYTYITPYYVTSTSTTTTTSTCTISQDYFITDSFTSGAGYTTYAPAMNWAVSYDYAPTRKEQKLAKQKISLLLKERVKKMSNDLTKRPPVGRTFTVVSPVWGFNVGDKFVVCKSSDTVSYKNWNSKEDQKLTYVKYEKSGKPYEAFFGSSDYEIECFWSHVKCDKHCAE
mgnify:CR=1 FL=1